MKKILIVLSVIIIFHVLILEKLIYFPYPEIFIYPYLVNNGLKPYQQILDQHFPGLFFLPINFNNLGLTSPEIARFWSIGVVVVIQILLFLVGKKLLGSPARALLINFLYLIWQPFLEGWVLWIDNFLPLFLLPAFYLLTQRKWIFFSGLLIGVAVVFKQTVLPLSGLIFLLIFWKTKSLKTPFSYLAGLSVPIVLIIAYFAKIGVLRDFWYWTIVFNLTTYAQFGTKVPPTVGFATRVLLIFSPAILLLFLKKEYKVTLLVFLVGALIGVFDRADFVHFQPALPFATMATGVVFFAFIKKYKFKVFVSAYVLIASWWLIIFYKGHIGNKVFFYDDQTRKLVEEVRKITIPEEKIFVFGTIPSVYQMTNTMPAGDILVFQFPWFLKVSEDRILRGIKRDQPRVIVMDTTVVDEDENITSFAKDIYEYIMQNYRRKKTVGTAGILLRKEN